MGTLSHQVKKTCVQLLHPKKWFVISKKFELLIILASFKVYFTPNTEIEVLVRTQLYTCSVQRPNRDEEIHMHDFSEVLWWDNIRWRFGDSGESVDLELTHLNREGDGGPLRQRCDTSVFRNSTKYPLPNRLRHPYSNHNFIALRHPGN